MVDTIECVKDMRKTAFILDDTEESFTFFKYKANIIDISEYILKEKMGK